MSDDAHRYGTSISNQRIENWWSHMRKSFTNWLTEFSKALVNEKVLSLGIRHLWKVVGLTFLPYYKPSWMNLAIIGIPITYANQDILQEQDVVAERELETNRCDVDLEEFFSYVVQMKVYLTLYEGGEKQKEILKNS